MKFEFSFTKNATITATTAASIAAAILICKRYFWIRSQLPRKNTTSGSLCHSTIAPLSSTFTSNSLTQADKQITITFTFGSYNILTKRFENASYGNYCKDEHKSWVYRRDLLTKQIAHMNFDILAIQEAQLGSFGTDFSSLQNYGYALIEPFEKGAHKNPEKSQKLAKTALIYKKEKFNAIWTNHRSRVLLTALQCTETNKIIYIINCHLEGAPAKVADRLSQIKHAIKLAEQHQIKNNIQPEKANVLICGDFNSSKKGAVYTLLGEGVLNASFRDEWCPDQKLVDTDFVIPYQMQDVYTVLRGSRVLPTFVANKRPSLIDFIFASKHMKVVHNKQVCTDSQFEDAMTVGIPNSWHPSDHFAIGTVLSV